MTDNNINNKFQERCFGAAIALSVIYLLNIIYYLITKDYNDIKNIANLSLAFSILFRISQTNKIINYISLTIFLLSTIYIIYIIETMKT